MVHTLRRNALIIDDNVAVVETLATALKAQGFQVFTATTVKEARFRIRTLAMNRVTIEFAIISNRMPGPMGMELCDYAAQNLDTKIMSVVTPPPAHAPEMDYNDQIKVWRKQMRDKELKSKMMHRD